MTITMRPQYLILCDGPGCDEAWAGGVSQFQAVADARDAGWQINWDPDIDLCPEHARASGERK